MIRTRLKRILFLWMLVLQGCLGTSEVLPHDEDPSKRGGAWLASKRFNPGRLKPPTKAPASDGRHEPASAGKAGKAGEAPARSLGPSFKLGESDGGPGVWEKAPKRPKGAGYQHEVKGAPEGVEYAVPVPGSKPDKVLFDGYKNHKLLDAKDWSRWPPEDEIFWQAGLMKDARRQLSAANGTRIEWHFPSKDKADAVRAFLQDNGIQGIDVVLTPKKK